MKSQRKKKTVRRKVNLIDDLPESILMLEIFSKLRNPRDIIVCKSVSKSWNSSFSSLHHKKSWALILNTDPPHEYCVTNDTCLEDWKGFKLNNYIDLDFNSSSDQVCVLASYRDVLLCLKKQSQFYLVNPVTMRWTRVPKTTRQYSNFPIGLSGDVSKSRFYVVKLIKFGASKIMFSVFDSKLGKWRERYISYSWTVYMQALNFGWPWTVYMQALNFNGALHWLARDGPIIAYNPEFTQKRKCRFIHRSQAMRHASYDDFTYVLETLTVSMGHLRIIQIVSYPFPDDNHHLVIWTLVDYEESIWKQENYHEPVYFRDMLSNLPWIREESSKLEMICPRPLHCHPDNPLLLYLNIQDFIVSLDVVTKKLRLITRISQSNQYNPVTPITLHLDPSLVPHHEGVLLPHM